MKISNILSLLIVSILILASWDSKAQIALSNTAELNKVKLGTTFFAMKDPASPKAATYVEAIKKYWTYTPVACIKYSDVEKNIAPNNSFVTITGTIMATSSVGLGGNSTPDFANTRLFLEFWTTNGHFTYKPGQRKHFDDADKIQLARIELATDYKAIANPSLLYQSDYDGAGHIRNWGVGIFSNYLQCLNKLLTEKQERKLNLESKDKTQLRKLATDTLFVPDYVLIKFNKNVGDETERHLEKELFSDYNLPYQVLTSADLNAKIVDHKSSFYYLLYIKNGSDKYVNVINAATGEVIYSAYTSLSFNLKSGDFKELQKAIQQK